jgi:Gluconate 2-dehydrogenase subunit 3
MDRRELLKMITVMTGGALIGGELLLSGCRNELSLGGATFSADDISFLDEVSDTILPGTTGSPGAKAAKVGKFMTVIVDDCYEPGDQVIFHEGIRRLNESAKKKFKSGFINLTPGQRKELLIGIDKMSKADQSKESPTHYFTMMKQLTLWGYFSSKEGATQALRYVAVPGKYEGCIDYKKGDKAWA